MSDGRIPQGSGIDFRNGALKITSIMRILPPLLSGSLFIVTVLLPPVFVCFAFPVSIDSAHHVTLNFENEGYMGGKISGDFSLPGSYIPLNNHGYFYNGSLVECSLHNAITLEMRMRVWNGELSEFDRYDYAVEPAITLFMKRNTIETHFRGGYINDITLGNGLTVKDLSNSGIIVKTQWNGWAGSMGIFTKGYGFCEDLYWTSLHPPFIPLEVTALCINTQSTESIVWELDKRYYFAGYLLPNVSFKLPWGTWYGEYGFRADYQRNVQALIEESPEYANAGLFGFKTGYRRQPLDLEGCIEFRAYQKGFIPVTGVEWSRFANVWDEDDSRANWIDFFDSRETSYWGYARIHAQYQVSGNWRLFFQDELLYFKSRQREAIAYPRLSDDSTYFPGMIAKYRPSTHFYRLGIGYYLFDGVSVEISVGNKLLNTREFLYSPYSQWGQRFIATEIPFGEARLKWVF